MAVYQVDEIIEKHEVLQIPNIHPEDLKMAVTFNSEIYYVSLNVNMSLIFLLFGYNFLLEYLSLKMF